MAFEPGAPRVRGAEAGRARRRIARAAVFTVALTLAVSGFFVSRAFRVPPPEPVEPPPAPARPDATLFDERPVTLTITAEWQKVAAVVPVYRVRSDRTLWRRMHFEDWNTVPNDTRDAALAAMVEEYRWAIDGPRVWRWMTAADWDAVPQPVRAMAFIRMARYWTRHYEVGREYDLPPAVVGDTLAALAMVESWFEHRGAYINADGTADLGLGGASAYCRSVMRRLYADHQVDFVLNDEDYDNPWHATRVMALWLQLMIAEADGDLDLAIRAYNAGTAAGKRGQGADYADNVVRKRRRFIRNTGAPPAWNALFAMMLGHDTNVPMRRAVLRTGDKVP